MKTMEVVKFLQTLQSGEIEINNLKQTFSLQEGLKRAKENIYFLTGLQKGLDKRGSDSDIISKKYFVIDIDIENAYEECFSIKLKDDIREIGLEIAKYLKEENSLFKDYCYIVFSGRGLHFYYLIEEKEYNSDIYSLGVREVYSNWNNYWGGNLLKADNACSNIARIMRLPGTINQKNGKECEIIDEQDCISKFNIEKLGNEKLKQIEAENKKREEEIKERLSEYNNGENDLYLKINSIPAYLIAQLLLPEFKFDGKKNFLNGKGGYTGYFYNNTLNVIHNGGSRHFNFGDSSSGYNSFSLVKNFKNWSNKETFIFFKKYLGMI